MSRDSNTHREGDGPGPADSEAKTFVVRGGARPDALPSVPGYEVEGVLGEGGMGVVYRARHVALKRVVALKMLRGAAATRGQERARFRAEAEALARLQHPNIVQVYETGEHAGEPFLALELVGGGTLGAWLRREPRPPRQAAALVEVLARAVAAAHAAGIAHRDLKPGNVLLAEDGTAKIADFGLAKWLDGDSGQTKTGQVMGTPNYMAPEQARGDKDVGAAADVWALGAILYECLTGRPPFLGTTVVETLEQVRLHEPITPARLQAGVPADLETVCLKCLEKEPARRYGSAVELADDLRRYLAGEPVRARPVGAVERGLKWARRRPALAGLWAAGLLLVIVSGGAAAALWYGGRLAAALGEAEEQRGLAERRGAEAAAANERLDQLRYLQEVQLARGDWEAAEVARAVGRLEGCDVARRGWEWRYVRRLTRPLADLGETGGGETRLVFSADGRHVITGEQMGGVVARDAAGGPARVVMEGTAPPKGPSAHIDGSPSCVALRRDGRLWGTHHRVGLAAWDVATGRRLTGRIAGAPGPSYTLAVRPDGKEAAAGSSPPDNNAVIRRVDLTTGEALPVLEGHTLPTACLAYSPDGRLLASGGRDGLVKVWAGDPRRELSTLKGFARTVVGVAFSPDGARLAACDQEGRVRVYDAAKGVEILTFDMQGEATCLAYGPDGRHLAAGMVDGTVGVWEAAGGRPAFTLRAHHRPGRRVWDVAFSPDGRRLATAGMDLRVRVWDVTGPPGVWRTRLPAPAKGTHWLVGVGRDGATAYLHSFDETVRRVDVATGRALEALPYKHAEPLRLVLPADGGRLVVNVGQHGGWHVWDVAGRRVVRTHRGDGYTVAGEAAAVSPDGKWLAIGQDVEGPGGRAERVMLWDTATGRGRTVLEGGVGKGGVAFSPDGRLLAVNAAGGAMVVVETATGAEVFRREDGAKQGWAVAFSGDGRWLAANHGPGGTRLWDTRGWVGAGWMRGGAAIDMAFTPDGARLATCDVDGAVTVWDPAAGQMALTFAAGRGAEHFKRVCFSGDGRRLMAFGDGGEVTTWDAGE